MMRSKTGAVKLEHGHRCLAIVAVCLFLMSCRSVPLERVVESPLPAPWAEASTADCDEAIWRAGRKSGWEIERLAPGRLRGTWHHLKHLAVATIAHDGSRISVEYQSSENLFASDNGQIHRNYHVAVRRLLEKIIAEPISTSP